MELDHLLDKLKMDHLEMQLDAVCEQAAQRQLDYKTFLAQALSTEWQGRYQRGIETRLKQARFPWIKTLDQFDFDFQPSIDRHQVRELAGMSFVERAHNVILLGPPEWEKRILPSDWPSKPWKLAIRSCSSPWRL
jgi:DNA replication protein DnaC